jgi:hypothetical protein
VLSVSEGMTLAGALHCARHMLLLTAVILLASPLEPPRLVDDPSGVFVPPLRTKDQMPSLEDREWALWPGVVGALSSLPTVLLGWVALSASSSAPGGQQLFKVAVVDFVVAGSLLLAGIIEYSIAQWHNQALLPDAQE